MQRAIGFNKTFVYKDLFCFLSSCWTSNEAWLSNSKHPKTKISLQELWWVYNPSSGRQPPFPFMVWRREKSGSAGLFWGRIARKIAVSAGLAFQVFSCKTHKTFFTSPSFFSPPPAPGGNAAHGENNAACLLDYFHHLTLNRNTTYPCWVTLWRWVFFFFFARRRLSKKRSRKWILSRQPL